MRPAILIFLLAFNANADTPIPFDTSVTIPHYDEPSDAEVAKQAGVGSMIPGVSRNCSWKGATCTSVDLFHIGQNLRMLQRVCTGKGEHFEFFCGGGPLFERRRVELLDVGRTDPAPAPPVDTCFVPGADCTALIAAEIGKATKSIELQAYGFTSAPIAAALVAAAKRGVKVTAVLDRSNQTAKYSAATFLEHASIPVYIDAKHAIAHNKVVVIDDATVIGGSFNYTANAQEHNAENVTVIRDVRVAAAFLANWKLHLEHSRRFAP